jgi:DNA-binding MarR family transcriptional regulator
MNQQGRTTPKLAAARSSRRDPALSDTERLLDLLPRLLGSTFRQILWRRALELELTYSQSQVLFYVEQHPGCHMGDVGRAFGVTLAAVTQVVDRLEQKRFVVRGDHPEDRRVYMLTPTREGKDLVDELRALQRDGLERVLAKISARNRARLIEGLQAWVDAAALVVEPEPARASRRAKLSQGRIFSQGRI